MISELDYWEHTKLGPKNLAQLGASLRHSCSMKGAGGAEGGGGCQPEGSFFIKSCSSKETLSHELRETLSKLCEIFNYSPAVLMFKE